MVLFFTHILFVVNHAINATLPERLQQHLFLSTMNHTDRTFFVWGLNSHNLHILVTAPFCCDRKSRAACAQSFALWQQATIEIMLAISLTIACSRYIYNGVILHAHPVCGESQNQRNTNREVATLHVISPWICKQQQKVRSWRAGTRAEKANKLKTKMSKSQGCWCNMIISQRCLLLKSLRTRYYILYSNKTLGGS